MTLDEFIDKLRFVGLDFFRVFYGCYPANVVDNKDPKKAGRIRVVCPDVGQIEEMRNKWIDPVFMGAGANRGFFWPPEIGDSVRVFYRQGKPNSPVAYIGGWFAYPEQGASEVPTEMGYTSGSSPVPVRRGWVTRMGHRLIFGEESGSEFVELVWHKARSGDQALTDKTKTAARTGESAKLRFEAAGVTLQDRKGAKVFLDSANDLVVVSDSRGNKVTLSSSGIELDAGSRSVTVKCGTFDVQANRTNLGTGASQAIPLGNLLLNFLRTHTHGTGVGPTSPPTPPPTEALLSQTNKTK